VLVNKIKYEVSEAVTKNIKRVSDVWVAVDSAGGISQAAVIVNSSNAPRGSSQPSHNKAVCLQKQPIIQV